MRLSFRKVHIVDIGPAENEIISLIKLSPIDGKTTSVLPKAGKYNIHLVRNTIQRCDDFTSILTVNCTYGVHMRSLNRTSSYTLSRLLNAHTVLL